MFFENNKHEIFTVNKQRYDLNKDDGKRHVQAYGINNASHRIFKFSLIQPR